jgi:non-heme chloroperoxidase
VRNGRSTSLSRLGALLDVRRGFKTYKGLPHGMCTTHPDVINPDLLAFLRN